MQERKKSLADDVKALLAEPPRDAIVLIEAGDLKKGAGLRGIVEAADGAMALPCYADEARDIDSVIDDELGKAGMSMTLEARQMLRRNLGGDRLASRGEVAKLTLYALGRNEITLDDVQALTGDVSGQSFDDAVDAVLAGQLDQFDTAFTVNAKPVAIPFLPCQAPCANSRPCMRCAGQWKPMVATPLRSSPRTSLRCFSPGAGWWKPRCSAGVSTPRPGAGPIAGRDPANTATA